MGNCLFLATPYALVDEEGCDRKQPLNIFTDWKAMIVGTRLTSPPRRLTYGPS